MKRVWMIVAVVCVVISGLSLWRRHTDAAFVIVTLGVISWFLHYRAGLKLLADASVKRDEEDVEDTDEHGS
jgi:hypothetical protein